MSARLFDPDALMREVRAKAGLSPSATTATLLRNAPERSNVAVVAARPASELDEAALAEAIEERAGLAADRVQSVYLDAWARLNHQKPFGVSEDEWRLALDDGGRFLDAWGADAATMRWTAGELFDVPREGQAGGLVWQLRGERVSALGEEHAQLTGGRIFKRLRTDYRVD